MYCLCAFASTQFLPYVQTLKDQRCSSSLGIDTLLFCPSVKRRAGLLTDTVEMHGGDILKFAGDAIIVCWSPTRELGIEVGSRSLSITMVGVGFNIHTFQTKPM